jgi:cephalosporin hydroxylase
VLTIIDRYIAKQFVGYFFAGLIVFVGIFLAADFTSAYIDHDLVFNNHFLGVEIWQNPFDMWVFQQMITELKPDVIIETGTAHGGSALFFAMMLEKLNPVGRVISVEIDPDVDNNISEARSFPVFRNRVSIIKGDSVSSQTLDRIQQAIEDIQRDKNAGRDSSDQQDLVVLVTLDSLHSAEHVLEELRVYSQFVSKGSYIVVQDTVIDSNPKFVDWFVLPWANGATAGPSQAVQEFLDKNTNFRRDKRWEKFYFTFYPGGFLKKSN